MGYGVPTGEIAVVGMAVESRSLGGRRTGGAQLGEGISAARVVGFCVLESRAHGNDEETCGWYTWKHTIATQSIGPQSRAPPAWHWMFHISPGTSRGCCNGG